MCAATAGADGNVTSAGGWCTPRFLTGHITALDSIGNAKLLIFGVFKRNLVLITAWSVTLWGCSWRPAINRHQNPLFLLWLLGF